MAKEDKCFTKKNKNGGSYTTCVDTKGKQLREKDKDVKTYKKVAKATKKYEAKQTKEDTSKYKKVLSATKKYEKKEDSKDVVMYKKMVKRMKAKPLMNVSAEMAAISASSQTTIVNGKPYIVTTKMFNGVMTSFGADSLRFAQREEVQRKVQERNAERKERMRKAKDIN